MESKKNGSHRNRVEWWLQGAGAGGIGKMLFKGINLQLEDE